MSVWFNRLLFGLNAIGGALICLMAVMVNGDVVGRAAFNHPLNAIPELVSMFIVVVVFLQLPYCVHLQQITRSDAVLMRLKNRRPRLAHALDALYHLTGALLFFTIAWFAGELTIASWASNEYVGSQGISDFAAWPVKACVTVGAGITAVEYTRQAVSHAFAARSRDAAARLAVGGGGLEL